MSEEKYEDKVLKALNLIVEQTKPQPQKPAESSKASTELINLHTHTPKEMFDCPTCGEPYLQEARKRLTPEILKEQREKQKQMKRPKLCEDCGEVLDGEKEEDCPSCHGHNY